MTDGRTLVGLFLCTDRDCNVILGSAQEFLKSTGAQCSPGTQLNALSTHPLLLFSVTLTIDLYCQEFEFLL